MNLMSTPAASKSPQDLIKEFWDRFLPSTSGQVTSIFPQNLYDKVQLLAYEQGSSSPRNAAETYETAANKCREQVQRIVRECRRRNEKFTDPDFDIESDHRLRIWNCLRGLVRDQDQSGSDDGVNCDAFPPFTGSVHRVDWIFERPSFTVDGFGTTDIKQGNCGDCWWLAAVATICNRQDLMQKICVARDTECGVYGFLFYRDGEWVSTVIDDNLYLTKDDFDIRGDQYDSTGKKAREHKKRKQTGSEALHFAKCDDPNETWLPLLEKAYAKIHGDYDAIDGGWSGEAVEDMTGGVTTTIVANRVLNKSALWKELVNSEENFVFAASAMQSGPGDTRGGLALGHAYSILRATEEADDEGNTVRLVLVRNPWGGRDSTGIGEWNGPWSDGSREWTPYWLKKLGHKFGDDGEFWMAYEDMLSTFKYLHRTRIFDEKWTVAQRWTSVTVPWITGYLHTKFVVDIKSAGPAVFVLSQLDNRYFRGLDGQYEFSLHFLLQKQGAKPGEHVALAQPAHFAEYRSVSTEVELDPGKYEVMIKVLATRDSKKKAVESIVKDYAEKSPQKLKQVGMNYDLAHLKDVDMNQTASKESKPENAGKEKDCTDGKYCEPVVIELSGLEILDGFRVNKKGQVLDEDGLLIGELEKGDVPSCAGKKVNVKGEVHDTDGQVIGQVKALPQPIDKVSTEVKVAELSLSAAEDKNKDGSKNEKLDDGKDGKENILGDGDKNKQEGNVKPESQPSEAADNMPPPWNAVCVVGLRVYTKSSEVTIELVKSESQKEAVKSSHEEAAPR